MPRDARTGNGPERTAAERARVLASISFDVVDPRSFDATEAMRRYFAELDERFEDGFDPGNTLVDDAPAFTGSNGVFLVVRSDRQVAGCGGVQRIELDDSNTPIDPDTGEAADESVLPTAEIKRMWINPGFRGIGLGRRMLVHLEEQARSLGATRIVLDTNAALTAAINMYEGAGYQPIEQYNDNPFAQRWFAKRL